MPQPDMLRPVMRSLASHCTPSHWQAGVESAPQPTPPLAATASASPSRLAANCGSALAISPALPAQHAPLSASTRACLMDSRAALPRLHLVLMCVRRWRGYGRGACRSSQCTASIQPSYDILPACICQQGYSPCRLWKMSAKSHRSATANMLSKGVHSGSCWHQHSKLAATYGMCARLDWHQLSPVAFCHE